MSRYESLRQNADKILAEIRTLLREDFKKFPISEVDAPISTRDISSDETDVKEAMSMVFFDCMRTDGSFVQTYQLLKQKPDKEVFKKLRDTLKSSLSHGSDYGIDTTNVKNLHKFILQVLGANISNKKTDKNFKLVNNGFSAANAIFNNSKIKNFIGTKNYATRGTVFDGIRKDAVKMFKDVKVDLSFPDNWCPGDFYVMNSKTPPKFMNIIELNSSFAGPSYPDGKIVAISLKMETAQAGKGTTFLKTVLSVSDIDPKKTIPTNKDSQDGLSYLSTKRLIQKYAIAKVPIEKELIAKKLSKPFKTIYDKVSDKKKIPTITKFYSFTNKQRKEQKKFIENNYLKMGSEASSMFPIMDKKVLGGNQTKAYSDGFKQAYNEFTQYVQQMGIKIQSPGADQFIAKIKQGKGSKKESGVQNILIKKSECYTRAIELIKKWSDSNKEISKPFKKLGTIDNPLLAITMFAISQHGANPDFFKVHGSDTGDMGTLEIFPAKSKVDKTTIIQTLTIRDSEGAAGFDASYNMKLNNVLYKTTLSFRYSDKSFRVEVQELEESMG